MFILTTMTGADPVTRWILVQWVARFSGLSWTGDYKELPGIFAVSKKSFDIAISYLVTEGYLGRTRKQDYSISKAIKLEHFEYYVTDYCEDYWRKSLQGDPSASIFWDKEIFSLLLDNPEQKQIGKKMTTSMRLVMLFLYSKADPAGYFVLREPASIKKTLGMTEFEFNQIIKKLIDIGELKFASEKLECELLRNGAYPIYLIAQRPYMRKIVRFGVFAERDSVIPNLLSDLYSLNFSKIKPRPSELALRYARPDTLFKELELIVKNKNLFVTLHHLCLRTVFALVPFTAAVKTNVQGELQIPNSWAKRPELRTKIIEKIFEGLVGEQALKESLMSVVQVNKCLSEGKQRDSSRIWMFNEIIVDLEKTILVLSAQLMTLGQRLTGPVRLVGWLHGQKMLAKTTDSSAKELNQISVARVLEVLVVENQIFSDCILLDDKLIDAEPQLIQRH